MRPPHRRFSRRLSGIAPATFAAETGLSALRRIHHMTQDHTTTVPSSIPTVPNTVPSPHLSAMIPNANRQAKPTPILFHHLAEYIIAGSASSLNHRPNFQPSTFHAGSLIPLPSATSAPHRLPYHFEVAAHLTRTTVFMVATRSSCRSRRTGRVLARSCLRPAWRGPGRSHPPVPATALSCPRPAGRGAFHFRPQGRSHSLGSL